MLESTIRCQSLTCTSIYSAIDACPNHSQCVIFLKHLLQVKMKRTHHDVYNPMERSSKIFAPEHYWEGCPYCTRNSLSWSEWSRFTTVFQSAESNNEYQCCKTCFKNIMHKHWDILRWWRWDGEGDSPEQFATSPCHSHHFLRSMGAAIMSRHAPLPRSKMPTCSATCSVFMS